MKSGNQPIARRSERIHVQMPVALHVDSNAQSDEHAVSTVDLSNNGVRVSAVPGLFPGQDVTIMVTISGQQRTIPGRVVWVGLEGTRLDGQAGIQFFRPVAPPL